jgi:hypothetical protein
MDEFLDGFVNVVSEGIAFLLRLIFIIPETVFATWEKMAQENTRGAALLLLILTPYLVRKAIGLVRKLVSKIRNRKGD